MFLKHYENYTEKERQACSPIEFVAFCFYNIHLYFETSFCILIS